MFRVVEVDGGEGGGGEEGEREGGREAARCKQINGRVPRSFAIFRIFWYI